MRTTIRFLLGDQPRELAAVDPTMTVLDYLRRIERRCGTKEGCAEGDCGACTVVLGELAGERLRYRAVNACIQFLPTLDGKQLLTVEDLKAPDGSLHPVQQAMVEANASQCGFCTPGFVMALFALYHASADLSERSAIDDALAGNLCRCTGYGPIVTAARRMHALAPGDRFGAQAMRTAAALQAWQSPETLALEGSGRRYFAPKTADALAALLMAHPDAVLLAGGTDVGLWVTKQHRHLDPVIYLGEVEALKRVEVGAEAIAIGAAATYAELHAVLAEPYPDFGELIRRLGATQIRNLATLGGNVANGSPIGDGPPALIALGARLVLRQGEARREMALEDFFLDYGKQDRRPGEFVEAIHLPLPQPGARFRCYKVSKRFDQDITAVLGAFNLTVTAGRVAAARIAFGGMAATPRRARACEAALVGRPWSERTVEDAQAALAEDFAPITDMRASADYRRRIAGNLLMKFLVETREPPSATRVLAAGRPVHA